jgi:transcriptional regulator with XRE-family HTH domain
MTQQDLAEAAGMPQPSIARIERGAVIPRTATLLELLAKTGHRLAVEPIGPEPPTTDRDGIRRRLAMPNPQRTREALVKPARDRAAGPLRALRRLRGHAVPFVLIGELAEAAHGAPIRGARIVEICHADTDVARDRLSRARDELGADADPARLRLVTRTEAGDDYEVLVRTAESMHVDAGFLVRVAALEDLIRIRLARGTPRDLEAAATLRATEAPG